jgi:hypothetical protein
LNLLDVLLGLGVGGIPPEGPDQLVKPLRPKKLFPLPPDLAGAQQPLPPEATQQPLPPEATQQPAPQPEPKAADTPVTNPNNAPTPDAYKSPPDLANMYLKLMEDSRHAAALDSGLTMIAAGLPHPNMDTRGQLLAMAANGDGSSGMSLSMQDLINLQKAQTEEADKAARAAQLPLLAKRYGLDDATVRYLDSSGQLDEVISKMANPDTEVVEAADGSKKLINKTTGDTIHELSGAKPRATEYVEKGDGSKVLVYTDDKTEVSTGKKLTDIAPKVETQVVQAADGSNVLIDKNTGEKLGTVTPAKDPETLELERADGSKALINKKDGTIIRELSPAKELNAEDKDKLAQINKDREAAGQKPMSMEEYLKMSKAGVTVNVGPTGIDYGDPPKDMAWKRDKEGKVLVDEDGAPMAVPIKGTEAYTKAQEAEKAQTGKEERKVGEYAITGEDTDRAIKLIEKTKGDWFSSTGRGAYLAPLYGTDAYQLSTYLDTVRGNIGFDKLQSMREASPTGGALGQVSDFENRLMQATQGSLRQGQDPDELIYNLKRADRLADAFVNGYKDPKTGEIRKLQSQADVDDLMKDIPKPPSLTGETEEQPKKRGPYKVEKLPEGQ